MISTIFFRLVWLGSFLCVATQSLAQEDTVEVAEVAAVRERIIVNVEHLAVESIAKAVTQLSAGDLRIFPETDANRLIVDGPKADMPAVVGLIRELDRPIPQIKVQLIEATLDSGTEEELKSGSLEELTKQLDTLMKSGEAKIVNKLTLQAGNNTSAETRIGASKPSVTGSNRGMKTYNFNEVGTVFQCTPRIAADGILVSYSYEKTDVLGTTDETATPPTVTNMRTHSTIRIPKNGAVVIGGQRPSNDGTVVNWNIVLSAEVTGG